MMTFYTNGREKWATVVDAMADIKEYPVGRPSTDMAVEA